MADTQSKKTRLNTLSKLSANLTEVLRQIESSEKLIIELENDIFTLKTKLEKVENWSMEQEALLARSEKTLLLQENSLRSALSLSKTLEKSIASLKKKNKALTIGAIFTPIVASAVTAIAMYNYNKNNLM